MNDREDFEKWRNDNQKTVLPNIYKDFHLNFGLLCWQAAPLAQQKKVEALEIQVQELREALRNYVKSGFGNRTDFYKQAEAHGIAELLLSTTPNPAEWVRRDRLELCAEVIAQDDGEVTSEFISSLLIIGTKLYRIKGE